MDAVREMVGLVGLEARFGSEVHADPASAWVVDLSAPASHVWVATRSDPLWLHHGPLEVVLEAGQMALASTEHPLLVRSHHAATSPPVVSDAAF